MSNRGATVSTKEVEKASTAFRQKLFMREIRFGSKSCVKEWPRREGKSHTLKQLVKPVFKRQRKKAQILQAAKMGRKVKVIHKDTQVVIVDDASEVLVNFIKCNRPDVRVVGLCTTGTFDKGGEATQKLAEWNVVFEK